MKLTSKIKNHEEIRKILYATIRVGFYENVKNMILCVGPHCTAELKSTITEHLENKFILDDL
jgi:hypothetical protein